MSSSATYPYWHPGGRFVAFSSNVVKQSFYAQHDKSIEVYDQSSSLVLYDILKNEISSVPKEGKAVSLQTFPAWSPGWKITVFLRSYTLRFSALRSAGRYAGRGDLSRQRFVGEG